MTATLADLLTIGSLRGFKHFEVTSRGREELILRVRNAVEANTPPFANSVSIAASCSHGDGQLRPGNAKSVRSITDEELYQDTNFTSFLIAAYARYGCPLVWPRSPRSRLREHHPADDPTMPLQLSITADWFKRDITLFDVLEYVLKATLPIGAARSPFAVDMTCFSTLPPEEAIVRAGAMIHFLLRAKRRSQSLPTEEVNRDIARLINISYVEMNAVLRT
ncbi:hypothetical protein HDU90_006049 [Geranomyces variabilis]|nr:hypothetical protein HDU90_006049 [Geranomyces variabilis]